MPCWFLLIALLLSLMYPTEGMEYLDFIGNGSTTHGSLDQMDHAILTGNSTKSLPDQFTICSSVYNSHFVTPQIFFQLLQDNGSRWINLFNGGYSLDPTVNAYQQFGAAMFINTDTSLYSPYFKTGGPYTAG